MLNPVFTSNRVHGANASVPVGRHTTGGLSWAVPYLAGLYALGVQVYPDLTKDLFMQVVRDTADKKECSYQGEKISARYFVNPVALINQLQEMNNAN